MGNRKYPVGKGWWALLDEYIPKLEQAGAHLANATAPFEKYGTLRIGEANMTDEVMALLEEMENKSAITCEDCGATARERELELLIFSPNIKYVKTLCDDCYTARSQQEIHSNSRQ